MHNAWWHCPRPWLALWFRPQKAGREYECISWSYLICILRQTRGDLFYWSISIFHYSIKYDGKTFDFFRSMRGVREGDPFSLSLFIIDMEWFSWVVNDVIDMNLISAYHTHSRVIQISHLMFVDDIPMFANGSTQLVHGILEVVNKFCCI